MNPDRSEALEIEINELRSRLWRLEEALRTQGIRVPAPFPQQADVPPIAAEAQIPADATESLPAEAPPTLHFSSFQSAPESSRADLSLESRIGSQWFNRVGIVAVLIGMAWFLKFAIDNHWIGPVGRVLIGLLAGTCFIAWSESFRARGYAAFSYSLKAVGSGTLYLSLWTAFQLYHLIPSGVAFAAMVAITAFNAFMAWAQDSELLALYAIAGCLSTPLLVSTGENHQIALFSYLLLMDLAILVLVALKPWSRLLFVTFVGSQLFLMAWWAEYYSDAQALRTACFAGSFFLLFALAPRLASWNTGLVPLDSNPLPTPSAWDSLALIVLPVLNAAAGFIAFYNLLDRPGATWAQPWLAVLFAAFYLLLLRLPENEFFHESPALLTSLHLATAVVFLTIAIPLRAHGRWLTVGWLAESAALLWVARRERSRLLQTLATGCLLLGLITLITVNPTAALTPLLNRRFATYLFAVAVCAFTAWIAAAAHKNGQFEMIVPWQNLAVAAALAVDLLILIAIGCEIDSFWWHLRWQGDFNRLEDFRTYAQFTYSAWFMLYGSLLLTLGIARRSAFLRWQALVLLTVSIGKVFLIDTSELSQGLRILSFLGLGALLLAVSFIYQRDYLHLRAPKHESETGETEQ
ncbi:MAG: DUF2339 domain-containing protein [Terracidiphilus sp.]|nr:DUF2339 domain-containing protein [Terracidiphilus sp.]